MSLYDDCEKLLGRRPLDDADIGLLSAVGFGLLVALVGAVLPGDYQDGRRDKVRKYLVGGGFGTFVLSAIGLLGHHL